MNHVIIYMRNVMSSNKITRKPVLLRIGLVFLYVCCESKRVWSIATYFQLSSFSS